jgi:outer membrane receptor protein involved in Fe transport
MPQFPVADTNIPNRKLRLAALLMSAASVSALCSQAAMAQTAPADNKVPEIVVTANRSNAESLQHVAAAISAVNIQQADRAGTGNLDDLAKFTPSLSITEGAPGYNKFDMRGLTTGAYAGSDTSDRSLVAVYLDDTPISVQGQTPDLRVYDLERVEILRGPQGTLYGASSMAGTIRFVTAKPNLTSTFGSLEATGATTEHGSGSYSLRGMFNTPLIADQLAVRGTFYTGEDGGYIDNIGLRNKKDANANRSTQGRLAIRWKPIDRFTLDFSGTYEKSNATGLNTALSGLPAYTTSTNSAEGTRDDFQLYSLNMDYDLGFADLISTTSYTWRRLGYSSSIESTIGYFFQDYGTGLPVGPGAYPLFEQPTSYSQQVADSIPAEHFKIDNKIQDEMQEVRLVSKNDGPIKWTVGVFYEHQRRNLYQDIPTPGFDTLSYENLFFGPFNTPNGLYNSKTVDGAFNANDIFSGLQNLEERQVALYTDDTWHATPKLDLTAGVRYFDFSENYYLFESGVYGVVDHVPLTTNAVQKASGFNPRFNASYHIDPDVMVYAEAAKGFRYGGANQPVPIGTSGIAGQCAQNLAGYGYTSAPLTFGPDHLWSYSVGEKAQLFDGRMTLNADAYYIDWKDVQTRLGLNCSYFFTDNKGAITSKGIEAESTLRVTPELTFSSNLSYTDSAANGNIPTVGAFDGDQTPYFPTWIASAFVYYDRSVGPGKLHVQASYQYRGPEHTTFDPSSTTLVNGVLTKNGPSSSFAVIPAQNNVSASLAYDFDRYEVGLYATNLTDGVKVTDITRATYYAPYQAGNFETVARPRTIGVRVKATF